MNKSIKTLLDNIQRFLYGELPLNEKDVEFLIALEEKIMTLQTGDCLSWYCDYDDSGNLYDFWKTFEYIDELGKKRYPNAGVHNKSGLHIKKISDNTICLETKEGYGANWERYTAYLN